MPSNQRPSKTKSWIIWFLPAFFMFYQYGIQVLAHFLCIFLIKHLVIFCMLRDTYSWGPQPARAILEQYI